jgi:two-component system sensor histidine kinase/response regulator
MKTSDSTSLQQLLLPEQFNRLQTLFEQTASERDAFVLTDSATMPASTPAAKPVRFVLVISASFSALLQGEALVAGAEQPGYQTSLSFEPELMRQFASTLLEQHSSAPWSHVLQQQSRNIVPNQIQQQSQFMLRLVALLATSAHCPVTEAVLRQQIEQERLLNQVTTQIRQSLELPVILKTAVEQVRQYLQVDRLVIYQLSTLPDPVSTLDARTVSSTSGHLTQYGSVIYEARSSESILTVMNLSDSHCFMQVLRRQNWQTLDIADAITDVEARYNQSPCLLRFLHQAQVRAKLIAPIRLSDQFWGLLIAHDCHQPRHWQDSERRFLQQIAGALAVAISQAQLYAEVQQQKQTLEARIVERTQALQDAMLTAQSANHAKSEFLATVSHELRTPLACIIGMSATLQRWSKDVLSERQQHFLQTIHESGEHLLTLINDILDVSQAEVGRLVLNLQPFSLANLAKQSLNAFASQAASQQVELELELHIDAERDSFTADPRRLRQILFNLLSNAIKFTPAGGRVVLRVFAQPELAVFQIQDTGIGISEAQLPLLFQKFQQLDSSYQREYQGTGLGLALTKQLVELHGGWIDVESRVEVGSTFTVKLPTSAVPASITASDEAEHVQTEGRIVLIEPQEESASLICDLLLAAGYQVVWMLEGSAALNQLEVLTPAAVIFNLNLPDIDGYHLIGCLRQKTSTRHLKLLALIPNGWSAAPTAVGQSVERLEDLVDDAVFLPIRPETLLQKIKMLISPD